MSIKKGILSSVLEILMEKKVAFSDIVPYLWFL